MKKSVFVPSHITGIFNICENNNPLKKGSCGIGFLLDKGVHTKVKKSSKDDISIKINGKEDKKNEAIIKETLKILNLNHGLKINQKIEVPIGSGFGSSASSALSVSIAISNVLNFKNDLIKSGQIAHIAEINLGSGLGDVIAETSKGLVFRIKPGAPGYGMTKRIAIPDELYVGCKTFSGIETSDIIENNSYKNKINSIGKELLNKFKKEENISNFLKYSLEFSKKTKLISPEVLNTVEAINKNKNILGSSMAMLGNTVFTFSKEKEIIENLEIDGLKIYKIEREGIRID